MTRTGENLYGDWERRIRDDVPRVGLRRTLARATLALTTLLALGSALFGFG